MLSKFSRSMIGFFQVNWKFVERNLVLPPRVTRYLSDGEKARASTFTLWRVKVAYGVLASKSHTITSALKPMWVTWSEKRFSQNSCWLDRTPFYIVKVYKFMDREIEDNSLFGIVDSHTVADYDSKQNADKSSRCVQSIVSGS